MIVIMTDEEQIHQGVDGLFKGIEYIVNVENHAGRFIANGENMGVCKLLNFTAKHLGMGIRFTWDGEGIRLNSWYMPMDAPKFKGFLHIFRRVYRNPGRFKDVIP